jgi:predicted ABC-type ATPase
MIFVATDSIDENIARIIQRAQGGGHGASEREVRAIHEASLTNLGAAVEAFERVDIYDSTASWSAPRLVATAHEGRLDRLGVTPSWFDKALPLPHS